MSVLIETTVGDLTIDLYTTVRPMTCQNFIKLAKTHYYNYSLIYNIKQNFCAQMGKSWKAKHTDSSFFIYTHGQKAVKFKSQQKLYWQDHISLYSGKEVDIPTMN